MVFNFECTDFTNIIQAENEEKWLELRKTGIGGSDAGAIMGLNKYASPLTVYMQKKGISNDFKGNVSTKWGHILEDPIRKESANDLGIKIESIDGMYTSKEYPFMNANLDGLCFIPDGEKATVNGIELTGIGGHEIKTSSKGDGFTEEEIPDSYYCQVQHYMCVTGLQWFILSVFFLNSKTVKHYVVPRNESFIAELIKSEKNFWEENVMKDIIPAPTGIESENEYLKNLEIDSVVTLDDSVLELLAEEKDLDSSIKVLEKKHNEIKDKILLELYKASENSENADKTTATVGNYKITYNKMVRKSVDTELLKKNGLFDEYAKESSYKTLRISELKK